NRDILLQRIDEALEATAFDEERMPFLSGEGFFANPDYAATLTVLHSREDAEAWLTRLAAIPAYYARETANMQRGIRTRFTQPRLVVENTLHAVRAQAVVPSSESPLLVPLAKLPETMPDSERVALQARGEVIYRDQIVPSLVALGEFLEHEYLPHARRALGA